MSGFPSPGDIATRFDVERLRGDWVLAQGGALGDDGLETSVLLSLFTDRRAEPDDVIPDGTTNRRGNWADAVTGQPMGSRLWLLSREKSVDAVLPRAEAYARESLDWMREDGVADRIDVVAQRVAGGAAPIRDRLELVIDIWRNGATLLSGRYGILWKPLS